MFEEKRKYYGMKDDELLGKEVNNYKEALQTSYEKFKEFEDTIPEIFKDICIVYESQYKSREIESLSNCMKNLCDFEEWLTTKLDCFD